MERRIEIEQKKIITFVPYSLVPQEMSINILSRVFQDRAPRHQAAEHPGGQLRDPQDRGLWAGPHL